MCDHSIRNFIWTACNIELRMVLSLILKSDDSHSNVLPSQSFKIIWNKRKVKLNCQYWFLAAKLDYSKTRKNKWKVYFGELNCTLWSYTVILVYFLFWSKHWNLIISTYKGFNKEKDNRKTNLFFKSTKTKLFFQSEGFSSKVKSKPSIHYSYSFQLRTDKSSYVATKNFCKCSSLHFWEIVEMSNLKHSDNSL